jgi:hypothetical protein
VSEDWRDELLGLLDDADAAGSRLAALLEGERWAFHREQVELLVDVVAATRRDLLDGTLARRLADAPLGLTRPFHELSGWPPDAEDLAGDLGAALAAAEHAWSRLRRSLPTP